MNTIYEVHASLVNSSASDMIDSNSLSFFFRSIVVIQNFFHPLLFLKMCFRVFRHALIWVDYDRNHIFLKKSTDKRNKKKWNWVQNNFAFFWKKLSSCYKYGQTLNVPWRRRSWFYFSQVESSKVTMYKFIINLISNFFFFFFKYIIIEFLQWWNGLFVLIFHDIWQQRKSKREKERGIVR